MASRERWRLNMQSHWVCSSAFTRHPNRLKAELPQTKLGTTRRETMFSLKQNQSNSSAHRRRRSLKIPNRTVGHDRVVERRSEKDRAVGGRILEISPGEIDGGEIDLGKIGVRQNRSEEIAAVEVCFGEIRAAEVGGFTNDRRERSVREIRPSEIGADEQGGTQIPAVKIGVQPRVFDSGPATPIAIWGQ